MDWAEALGAVVREATMFAAVGLLIGGLDDLLVDALFLRHRWKRRRVPSLRVTDLPPPGATRIAVLVPAWDECAVIGAMLRATTARWAGLDVRILVGTYPNDPATIAAARAAAAEDGRIRVVVGPRAGPTTKADCLNVLWRALAPGLDTCAAVAIHDAEDLVHPDEPRVFAALLRDHDAVQLPVEALIDPRARLVSGYVADEFAESHAKTMVVRGAIGAGLPLAGTGCALSARMLAALAAERGGLPFDPESLVEDYELGLRIAALGGRSVFARVRDGVGGTVAVRSLFPPTIRAAVRQRARWTAGIALSGWDRTGWAPRRGAVADHWMRARDRRAPLAALVLAAAYLGALAWLAAAALHAWVGTPAIDEAPSVLMAITSALLAWRVAVRAVFVARLRGWREGAWAVPRIGVGNLVALLATPAAMARYLRMLAGHRPRWDKTPHRFPTQLAP